MPDILIQLPTAQKVQSRYKQGMMQGQHSCTPEGVLQVLTPGAQQNELHALAHQPVKALPDEVHALLLVQAPNECQDRHVRILWQPQLLQHINASTLRVCRPAGCK